MLHRQENGQHIQCFDGPAQLATEIILDADEQITLTDTKGLEYDVAAKDWGIYATPSLGHRLPRFGLKAAVVEAKGERYLVLVSMNHIEDFMADMNNCGATLLGWLPDSLVQRA